MDSDRQETLILGIDIGSTTVKAVVVDVSSREIVWSDYQRHETRQADKTLELLKAIETRFGELHQRARVFVTGSGARPLATPLGAGFVQEVNAVALAVETQHPDAGSVVKLGGQDAKFIVFKVDPRSGQKLPVCSMNDKCASGTGATIDKCLTKIGMTAEEASAVRFDVTKLHKVAAKCGVFAETDIVNLVKSGIRAPKILCSLADAIVQQNLSVLARGNTLRHKVLLLGGPNTYLPVLQECWRVRVPETWRERRYDYPSDVPIDQLILVPPNAQYYAAYGAAIYGLEEPQHVGRYRGCAVLERHIADEDRAGRRTGGGPPLIHSTEELHEFKRTWDPPSFLPPQLIRGQTIRGVIGLDGGSTSSKAVLLDEQGEPDRLASDWTAVPC